MRAHAGALRRPRETVPSRRWSDGDRPAVSTSTGVRLRCSSKRMQIVGRAGDLERRVENVGVGAQLLDGADAESVGREQAQPLTAARALLRRDLRDRRRLAASGRADEHFRARVVVARAPRDRPAGMPAHRADAPATRRAVPTSGIEFATSTAIAASSRSRRAARRARRPGSAAPARSAGVG